MRTVAHLSIAFACTLPAVAAAQMRPVASPAPSVSNLPSAQPQAATAPVNPTRIQWDGTRLLIDANGESMPEILGRMSKEIGMTITGGVPDERVYGKYGPAPVQTVLSELFAGLSVNMMLVNESPTQPKQLILTPRTGGATPPSTRPAVAGYTQQPARTSSPLQPVSSFRPQPTDNPTAMPPAPVEAPPMAAIPATNDNAAQPDANTSDTTPTDSNSSDSAQPQSPNGVRTPEQIFEELRKRMQQNSQQPANSPQNK